MVILQINQEFSLILYCFLSESVEQEKSWDIRWIEHLQFSQNTKQKNHRFSIVKRIKNRIFSIQSEQRTENIKKTQNTKQDTKHRFPIITTPKRTWKYILKQQLWSEKMFQYVDDIIAAREQANDKLREELVRYLIQDTICC